MKKILLSAACCILFCFSAKTENKITYPYPFNPVQGLVDTIEKEYRQEICLNGSWQFMPVYQAKVSDFVWPSHFSWEKIPLKIPSPWNVNDFTDGTGGDFIAYPSYPKTWETAQIGWMKKEIFVPANWSGKQFILHFEGILGKAQIYVNKQKVGENFELFLPYEADVTQALKPGEKNEIVVGVAKSSLFNDRGKYGARTYVGGSMWGTEMAGIWQDVYLFAFPLVYIRDLFIQPDLQNHTLGIEVEIKNCTDRSHTVRLEGDVRKWHNLAGHTLHQAPEQKGELSPDAVLQFPPLKNITLPPQSVTKVRLENKQVSSLAYWTPDTPRLYGAVLSLKEKKNTLDKKQERFGWRQFTIAGNQLLLNGSPIRLKGDSWHFTGVPQMTRRYAWTWFHMLKDANANAVRFHAQPFPRFYLDVADEMGICVLDETGIWSSDGGPKIDSEAYWESCKEHLIRLLKRDKNHASVFGWSVCNETIPVAVHVFKAPEELVERQIKEINAWVDLVAAYDSTRPWISGDGETDRLTHLPTLMGHYGDVNTIKKWSSQGKPWGIGEQSMAYYGTPAQAAAYNGERAYESMVGRMEAIAKESYSLIRLQQENNASYSCIFNLVWYGLQPLELGLKDTTRKPTEEDGIFFTFKEGSYGMQPERLGPYTTTLNPGYDPFLPLYRPWPLFDAVRCANATPMLPYEAPSCSTKREQSVALRADKIFVVGGTSSELKNELEELGMKIETSGMPTDKSLVILDGNQIPSELQQRETWKNALKKGSRIFILGITPENLEAINTFLPVPVSLSERKATSFLIQEKAPLLQGLTHADFYFSELLPRGKLAMQYGLTGDFIHKANVQLRACNTEWQCWNYRPETSKTGYVLRSERETKGSDVVIASLQSGQAEFILSTLDLTPIKRETSVLRSKIWQNAGACLSDDNLADMQALDAEAFLHRALIWGPVYVDNLPPGQWLTTDFLGEESSIRPSLNKQTGKGTWKVVTSREKGIFDFSTDYRAGNKKCPVTYLSYWIYSPRSLSNLLIEPDMPALDMFVTLQGNFSVWLNGKQITSQEGGTNKEETKIPGLKLEKGWNRFVIKWVSAGEVKDKTVQVRFYSTDKKFMKQIRSAVLHE